MKKDVLPGRYTTLWFQATKVGTFHLFCAQYCGAFHAGMIGSIIVQEPDEYERWLAGGAPGESMEAGRRKSISGQWLHHLPPGRRHGSRAISARRVPDIRSS